jgi:SNF2 family DNA or RNA helicase
MLLSPKAAGVGLTLTAANHVIHLSRWWNPAVEDQCTDRVYRIGQQRDVHVHLPIAVHPTYGERSFDANLHRLLEKKRALSMGLFAPPAASAAEIAQLADDCLSGARRA